MTVTTAKHSHFAPSAATLAWAAQARRALQQRGAARTPAALSDGTLAPFGALRTPSFGEGNRTGL